MNQMQTEQYNPNEQEKSVFRGKIAVSIYAIVVLAVLAATFLLFYTNIYNGNMKDSNTPQEPRVFSLYSNNTESESLYQPEDMEEPLGGVINLTLVDKNLYPRQQNEFAVLKLYQYNPGTDSAPTPISGLDIIAYMADERNAENVLAFGSFAPPVRYDDDLELDIQRIFASHTPQIFWRKDAVLEQISTSTELSTMGEFITRKRTPKIAHNSNDIVYDVQTSESKNAMQEVYPLDTWHILKIDEETGQESYVTSGAHAVWSRDDEYIFFVRADGIYAKKMGVEEGVEGKIIPTPLSFEGFRYNTQLQISKDGEYLVFNYLKYSEGGTKVDAVVEIHRIQEGEPLPDTQRVYNINIDNGMVFWPLLSPGGRYVSLQLAESTNPTAFTVESVRLIIFDLLTEKVVDEVSLENFDFLSAFTTSWIET